MADTGSSLKFDLTPDPRVLVALTHTPLQPMDALCELIDNAIDAFGSAERAGRPVEHPLVSVDLPGQAEVSRGSGTVRVRDNGTGLTADQAEKSLKAGFSGNNPFDSLGLFGMGFNIATGKIGQTTRLLTAREEDEFALEVVVDLIALQEARSYVVPVQTIEKPVELSHGTVLEITDWWPAGSGNAGFTKKLAAYSKPTVRDELGRRYAPILREANVRLVVNREPCEPFEHCVWDRSRYVERQGHGRIPAVFDFNEQLGSQTRCADCSALIRPPESECPNCSSQSFRTIEERVQGWVGIQRFDDETRFGVDLIRNGRTIRIGEQPAFFSFTDDLKRTTKDYPIDNQYGRIIGEIHLDHVPVDFLKQDFQRGSPEWLAAMSYIRGDSSLQPTKPGADSNTSPVFKLYQGYRRVRNPGRSDLYMGYWDVAADKPKRIAREVEREYYQRFLNREPGYFDDAEWWRQVEAAEEKPLDPLVQCPECGADNLDSTEQCVACETVLRGKPCVSCETTILQSAVVCPSCGASQVPDVHEPWSCAVCHKANGSDAEACAECSHTRGTPSPCSHAALHESSVLDDDLSIEGCSVRLADDTASDPLDVRVYAARGPLTPVWKGPDVPLVAFRGQELEVFVDLNHPVVKTLRVRPEELVSAEVAQFIYEANRRLVAETQRGALHSVPVLIGQILQERWSGELEETPEKVKEQIRRLFDAAREVLAGSVSERGADLYEELTDDQVKQLAAALIELGESPARLEKLRKSAAFILYVDDDTLVDLFRMAPELFFDGHVWSTEYAELDLESVVLEEIQEQVLASYTNALEDCTAYLRARRPDPLVTHRAASSVELLTRRLVA